MSAWLKKLIDSEHFKLTGGKERENSIFAHFSPSQSYSEKHRFKKIELLQNDNETGRIISQPH